MQRVELNHPVGSLHCPFCGNCVIREVDDQAPTVSPCEHTLFVAHDEGYEYRSEKFMELCSQDKSGVDFESPDDGYDAVTDSLELPNSIKFASYVPAPSFFGLYVGFWGK